MKVTQVTGADVDSAYCCMSEVPPDVSWTDFLPESRKWFARNLGKHVEGYHLLDGDRVVGHVYYATSENALVPYEIDPGVACVYCTELLRAYLHKGYGRMLFDYVKRDLEDRGFGGIVIPATDLDEWMHYELFLKQGFTLVTEHPPFYKVMFFPLTAHDITIRPIDLDYAPATDKMEVTLFDNFFCPVGAYMNHLIKTVAHSFGNKVKIVERAATLENVRRYGTLDPLINGKVKLPGPASEDSVRKAITEELDAFGSI